MPMARVNDERLAELTKERTLEWGREHWTLFPCSKNSKLRVINGSDYHWVMKGMPLGFALDRIADYLRDVASDTQILAKAANDANSCAEQLVIDGYLEAAADASRVFNATHDVINRTVQGVYRRKAATVEPEIVMPQRVSLLGERTELPTPTFRRANLPLGAGPHVTEVVFPEAPYEMPIGPRTRRTHPFRRELASA
jgi:hypothetical protein